MAYSRRSKKNVNGKGRRTYRGKESAGRNGKFHYKQKLFLRYTNEDDPQIRGKYVSLDLIKKIADLTQEVVEGLIEEDRAIAEKAKAYWLDTIKRITPVDTGMLRDGWACNINYNNTSWWLEWENPAEYVYAQNDGKAGVTPTGGEYYYPGYHFLEQADFATQLYVEKLKQEAANRIANKARSKGAR